MDATQIMQLLAGKYPVLLLVFGVLGVLVVLAQMIIPLTPSKKDDDAWEKIKAWPVVGSILSALLLFAPIQKK